MLIHSSIVLIFKHFLKSNIIEIRHREMMLEKFKKCGCAVNGGFKLPKTMRDWKS